MNVRSLRAGYCTLDPGGAVVRVAHVAAALVAAGAAQIYSTPAAPQ